MGKAALGAAITVAVLGAGSVGALAWSVGTTTQRLTEQPRALGQLFPFVKVTRNDVSRGLFSATHELTLRVGCLPAPSGQGQPVPLDLSLREHVRSGALVDGTLAHIDTELVLPEAAAAQLTRVFGSPKPLAIHTRALVSGELVSELALAPATLDEPGVGGFRSGPVRLSVRVREGKAPGSYAFTVEHPAVELESRAPGASLRMHLGAGRGATELGARPDPQLWLGPLTSHHELSSLAIDADVTGPGGQTAPPLHAELTRARWTSDATVKDGLYSSAGSMELAGKVMGTTIDSLSVKSRMDRIAIAPYQHLVTRVFEHAFRCDAAGSDPAALLAELAKDAGEILAHDPELALDPLRFVMDGKALELSASFGTRGVSAADTAAPVPLWLLSKGYAKLRLAVDTALVEQVAATALASGGAGQAAGNPAGGALAARLMVAQGIAGAVSAGYVEQQGARVQAALAVEGGQVLLNGKPLPPELLSALTGAVAAQGITPPTGP